MSHSEPKSTATYSKKRSSNRKRRRRRWFILLALLFGTLIAVLGGEVCLRAYVAFRGWTPNCYATGQAFFVPHPEAGRTLRPGLRLKSSTYDVAVNELGFRGPEIGRIKPEGTARIVVIGGSSVFGYLVGEGLDSCRLLETSLTEQGHSVEVINAGVPGYNLTQCRHRFKSSIAELLPDIAIVYAGWNESPFLVRENPKSLPRCPEPSPLWQRMLAESTLYGFLRYRLFPPDAPEFAAPADVSTSVTPAGRDLFETELDLLLRTIETSGAKILLCTQVSASEADPSDAGFDRLSRYLGNEQQQVELNQEIGRWINNELREKAQSDGYTLIDCAAEVPASTRTLGDAIHLTQEGHQQVADVWFRALENTELIK